MWVVPVPLRLCGGLGLPATAMQDRLDVAVGLLDTLEHAFQRLAGKRIAGFK
jgi:hypothetical protein